MEWKEVRLDEIARFSQGKQIPVDQQQETKSDNTERFIRIVDYTSGGTQPPRYVTKDSRYHVAEDDIVMIRYGTPGKVYRGLEGIIANNMFKIEPKSLDVDKDYLFYFLSMNSIFNQLMAMNSSSTMPAISFGMFKHVHLRYPPISTQRRISSILSSLDRKIELNNKINATLEEMAQALFKSWLTNCEDKVTLGDLTENVTDYSKCSSEKVVLINSSDVTEGRFEHHTYTENKDLKGHFKKRFQKGDILYSQVRPRNRHWALCYFAADDYLASTQLMIIRNKKELLSSILLYQYLISNEVWQEFTLKTETRSGTFPQGNYEEMSSIIVPFRANNNEISAQLASIYDKIYSCYQETLTLTHLRDTLLPRLMSGEIELEDTL